MSEHQPTHEQELLPTVEEVDSDAETETVTDEGEEMEWDTLEDELYEQWLAAQGCEYCSGCQYCEESSAFEDGTDT
jgi:hypothetical protein